MHDEQGAQRRFFVIWQRSLALLGILCLFAAVAVALLMLGTVQDAAGGGVPSGWRYGPGGRAVAAVAILVALGLGLLMPWLLRRNSLGR